MTVRISVPAPQRIRVYLAGAHSVTAVAAVVPFDGTSSLMAPLGYTNASGTLTVLAPGYHRFYGRIEVAATALLSEIVLAVEADLGAGFVTVARRRCPMGGSALVVSDAAAPEISGAADLPKDALVRLMAQATGAASAALVAGDGVTIFEAHRVPG